MGIEKWKQFNALVGEATDSARIKANNLTSKMFLREVTDEEINEIKKQSNIDVSGMKHEITSKELHHALKTHGQSDEAVKHPGQRTLTKEDLSLIPAVINAPNDIKVQAHGKNKTSIIYSKKFKDETICYVERVIETSNEFEPRLTTKTVWAQNAETGVESSSAMVYTPYRDTSLSPLPAEKSSSNLSENGGGSETFRFAPRRAYPG